MDLKTHTRAGALKGLLGTSTIHKSIKIISIVFTIAGGMLFASSCSKKAIRPHELLECKIEMVSFDKLSIDEFAEWLKGKSRELDPAKKGIIVKLQREGIYSIESPPMEWRRTTLKAKNIKISEILTLVGSETGTYIYITDDEIVIRAN